MQTQILLVDDDPQALESTRKILEMAGYSVLSQQDGQAALECVRDHAPALIVSDVRMPRMTGLEFVRALRVMGNRTPVVLMTAFGKVEEAVAAMKFGAVDFLTKPFRRQTLLEAVKNAQAESRVLAPVGADLLGQSLAMRQVRELITKVAPTLATVLIQGESGTGKERVARAVHRASARAAGPLVAINCAALPESLMEAELMGWEKGAFTGAGQARAGLIESSEGGTLFLDEIGDMPLALQAKLLRVLQDGEVRRLGGTESKRVQIRLIAATHRDLRQSVSEGKFREDLFYRLEVIRIEIAPLRNRVEDIPDLAYALLREVQTRTAEGEPRVRGIAEDAMEQLLVHNWPGNVRELANVLERATVLADSEWITVRDLPEFLQERVSGRGSFGELSTSRGVIDPPVGTTLKEVEDRLIARTLEATHGDKNLAAQILGVNPRTLYRWLEAQHQPASTDSEQ